MQHEPNEWRTQTGQLKGCVRSASGNLAIQSGQPAPNCGRQWGLGGRCGWDTGINQITHARPLWLAQLYLGHPPAARGEGPPAERHRAQQKPWHPGFHRPWRKQGLHWLYQVWGVSRGGCGRR